MAGRDEDDAKETTTGSSKGEHESAYHVFATSVSCIVVGSKPDQLVEMYRQRWGIETAFRCYEEVQLRTTSRNESFRLLLLFFPMLLYNAWILARHLFCRGGVSIKQMILEILQIYGGADPGVGSTDQYGRPRLTHAISTGNRIPRRPAHLLHVVGIRG